MKSQVYSIPFSANAGFYLRQWKVEDAAWYVAARDEEIFQWTTEKKCLTVAEAEEANRKINEQCDVFCFVIVDSHSQNLLGNIALTIDSLDEKSVEVMYWLAPQGRGRGIATEAVKQVSDWAFQTLNSRRILLKTLRANVRSQRVAERADFSLLQPEGEKPEAEYLWFERRAFPR